MRYAFGWTQEQGSHSAENSLYRARCTFPQRPVHYRTNAVPASTCPFGGGNRCAVAGAACAAQGFIGHFKGSSGSRGRRSCGQRTTCAGKNPPLRTRSQRAPSMPRLRPSHRLYQRRLICRHLPPSLSLLAPESAATAGAPAVAAVAAALLGDPDQGGPEGSKS